MSTLGAGPRRAVYRALIGNYEQLREEEVARDSDVAFICLTDDPTLTSGTWQIEVVEPRMPRDLTRSARALKILGHPVLEEYDETLWIDNTVALTQPPDRLFEEWLADADLAAPLHSFRTSVLAEAEAVIDGGLDDFARVYEQVTHYLATDAAVLEENPHWTGMLARRRTDAVTATMRVWWEDVLRYSRRDQLSFMPAVRSQHVRMRSVPVGTLSSVWHEWPRAEGRDPTRLGSGLRESLRPPAARLGVLEQALEEATHALAVTVAAREEVIAGLETAVADAEQRAAEAQAELDRVRHERNVTAQALHRARRRIRRLRQEAKRPRRWRERLTRSRRTRDPGGARV